MPYIIIIVTIIFTHRINYIDTILDVFRPPRYILGTDDPIAWAPTTFRAL